MNPEHNIGPALTQELALVAGSVQAPPAPAVADLVHRAEHGVRRNRRRKATAGSLLVAAAVAGAVLAGSRIGDPDAAPPPAPQPTETPGVFGVEAPIRTWVDRYGRLHLAGATFDDAIYANAQTTDDLTTAATGEYDGGDTAVFLGTTRVGTLPKVYESDLPVSPDARTIAYTEFGNATRTKVSIVVVRVSPDGITELGRLPVGSFWAGSGSETRQRLFRVTDDGTVTYGGNTGRDGYTWTPGSEPRPADTGAFTGTPEGFPSVNLGNALGQITLNRQGTWGAWPTDVAPGSDPDSPTFTGLTVQRPGEVASRWSFDFADDYAYVNLVFWETETTVILYADRRPPGQTSDGDYVRCDVVKHRCEDAPEPPGSNSAP